MEFSEPFELTRMLKTSPTKPKNPYYTNAHTSQSEIDKMLEYAEHIDDCINYSPPGVILPSSSHDSANSMEQEQPELAESPPVPQQDAEAIIEVTKDESYAESFLSSMGKVSSLTLSLSRSPAAVSSLNPDIMKLRIYYFSTPNYIDLPLPKNITAEVLIPKALSAYLRSDLNRSHPLPYGPVPEAYEVWMVDDDTNLPDTDFPVEKDRIVSELAVDCLALCGVSGFSVEERSVSHDNWRRVSEFASTAGTPLKIHFQENFTVLNASPEAKLRDIVHLIEKKFPGTYLNPDEYEFKIFVEMEDAIQKEECIVDMDLEVKALGTMELTFVKKTYRDSPSCLPVPEKLPVIPELEKDKYDPKKFYMTRAQASAYKIYYLIKYNRRGKGQKRALGIDQLRLYNMTLTQAKKELSRAPGSGAQNVVKNKLKSFIKSVTHRPEILISSIETVKQDPNKLNCFTVEYLYENNRKKKYFETENPGVAAEIVAKISKIMELQAVKG